jgi:hypothetical protein
VKRAFGLLLALAVAGCAPAPRAPLDAMHALSSGELVLVGRVELVPPLRKGEQRVRGLVVGDVENKMFLIADERLRPLPHDPAIADFAGRIEAPLGKLFFVRSRSEPFYILGGILFIEIGGDSMQRVYFPGGLRVAAEPGDRALYVGTLRYHRDEFFAINRVSVVDEYAEANAEFAKRFGSGQRLRKALMAPAKR